MQSRLAFLPVLGVMALVACAAPESEPEDIGSSEQALSQNLLPEIEPNGTSAQATAIGANVVVRGDIYPNADVDFFSFSGAMNDRVYVAMMGSSTASSSDADLEVIDTNGTTVLEYDDENGTFGTFSPSIAGTLLPGAGTFFVRGFGFTAATQVRPYHMHFRVQTGAPTAETEPNDTPMMANALPSSGWVSGSTSSVNDIDLFSLTLAAGDTVFASLDLDPERDTIQWNGTLGFGPLGTLPNYIVNDAGGGPPDSEALFMTVRDAGIYYVGVGSSGTIGTYNLSVSVHPATAATPTCTTYNSTDVPKVLPINTPSVTSIVTVPSTPRVADIDVHVTLDHAFMTDVDLTLMSPAGDEIGLATDVGPGAAGVMSLVYDDEGGVPVATNSTGLINAVVVQPEASYRLHWFDGVNAGGNWTLTMRDDTLATNGGNLTAWGITVCEPAAAPACPMGTYQDTIFTTDFETNDAGFTHSGTADEWARGLPSAAPFTTCNGGMNCFKTDLTGTYNASSDQNLLSPPINLANVQGPIILSWAQKYQVENATFDHAFVDVQLVGGMSPTRLFEFKDATMTTLAGPTTIQEAAGWGVHTRNITSYAGMNVEVRYHLDSDTTVQLGGMGVDDVTVTGCRPIVCGDGVVSTGEACDDGNTMDLDGCSMTCTVEAGWMCTGQPSICTTTCGDGIVAGMEACDDMNILDGDGCSMTCTVETGWMCTGMPLSVCTPICGDGLLVGTEACDDMNILDGDGCSMTCTVEAGWTCTGTPSVCTETCGDGMVVGSESCDDGNTTAGDGCDATCMEEAGYDCMGMPSVCSPICGDSMVIAPEECDDGNTTNGDGCDSMCQDEGAGGAGGGGPTTATGTGTGTGTTTGGAQPPDLDAEGGCGCTTPGRSSSDMRWAFALGALSFMALRRRGRRTRISA